MLFKNETPWSNTMSTLATCHIKSPIVPRTLLIKKKSRIAVRANYKVTLITPGGDETFECDGDTYILDAAEQEGLNLPYSCREGTCSTCAARLVWGYIDQSDQSFLSEEQVEANYVMLCVAYPKDDCKLKIEVEDELF
jgi:ferredoxin|tara:strand:- start:680 stop:1093 length:414 start_codon:yes stop_codon:yes gene_type:complete